MEANNGNHWKSSINIESNPQSNQNNDVIHRHVPNSMDTMLNVRTLEIPVQHPTGSCHDICDTGKLWRSLEWNSIFGDTSREE